MLGFLKPIARRLVSWILVHGREELENAVAAEIAKRTAPADASTGSTTTIPRST